MYRALYRKWRPEKFADVVGQPSITTALQNQLTHDKVGHAYLFTGTRGTGKTTCAKIFAKAVNCLHRDAKGDPCCECDICKGIDNGSVMDVAEIDAASNNGVDSIRDLREETAYTPSVCSYKVYIIDEVHMLSMAAFNALLKIMEEPPSHVIFILATTEIHKVPATILSRCQRYDFTRIATPDLSARVLFVAEEEKINLTPAAAGLIARLADGAMRDALSILDTCAGVTNDVDEEVVRLMAGVTDKGYLFSMSEALQTGDAGKALALVAQLREKSIDLKRLCDELVLHYRNLLLAGVSGGGDLLSGVSAEEEMRYVEASKNVSQAACIRAIQMLGKAMEKMRGGAGARVELELALFMLCAPAAQLQPQSTAPQAAARAPISAPFVAASSPIPMGEAPPALAPPPAPAPIAQPKAAVPGRAPQTQNPSPSIALAPPPPLQDGVEEEPFAQWDIVVAAMEPKDKLLYNYMKAAKAYYNGHHVLIDGSELFLQYLHDNKGAGELVKRNLCEVTGTRYAIGPYLKKTTQELPQQTVEDGLAHLSAQGIEIVYQDQ